MALMAYGETPVQSFYVHSQFSRDDFLDNVDMISAMVSGFSIRYRCIIIANVAGLVKLVHTLKTPLSNVAHG